MCILSTIHSVHVYTVNNGLSNEVGMHTRIHSVFSGVHCEGISASLLQPRQSILMSAWSGAREEEREDGREEREAGKKKDQRRRKRERAEGEREGKN